jgi:hypothetical protein
MKVKLKLDVESIKEWLLEHGEKVAFSVVGVVFLLFTYSAFSRETLDASKQPDRLKKAAEEVREKVASSTFDQAREGIQVVDYTARAISKPVKADHYALTKPWNPPDSDPKAKRGDPEVLGAEELRVAAGFDVFSFKPDGAEGGPGQPNAKLQPQPWAVVTGLVPIARQSQEFARVFAEAVGADPKQDVPNYYMPILERTEVDESKPDKEKWEDVRAATKYESQWSGFAKEIVSEKYTDLELTGHLCVLFYNEWGESVSHPKVPLVGEERVRPVEPAAEAAEAEAPAAPVEAKAEPMFRERAQRPVPQEAGARKPPEAKPADEEEAVDYLLLRVFDYTVEPGKKYRYRVTITLHNPNHLRSPLHLKNPESAVKEGLLGKPSATTGVVTIPDGHRILAGEVVAGSRFSEPSGTVLVTAIDREEGIQAAAELKNVHRGTLANKMQAKVPVEDPRNHQVKEKTLDFDSNILVLDIYGGRTLPGRRKGPTITTPGEVLLLDAEGNMIVRSELDDRLLYDKSIVRKAEEEARKPLLDDDKQEAPKRSRKKALLDGNR